MSYRLMARGYPHSVRDCDFEDSTRKLALELVKEYPDAWIECKDDTGRLVHLIEPGFRFASERSGAKPIPGDVPLFDADALPTPSRMGMTGEAGS